MLVVKMSTSKPETKCAMRDETWDYIILNPFFFFSYIQVYIYMYLNLYMHSFT